MKIIGLPGRKQETEQWMVELFEAIQFSEADIVRYRSWDEDIEFDIPLEAEKLKNLSVDLVIAKSIGTLITTTAYNSFSFMPRQAVFIGNPLRRLTPEFLELLDNFANQVPILFIQQTSDYNGSYKQVVSIAQKYPLAKTHEVPGNDHFYGNIGELVSIIKPSTEI